MLNITNIQTTIAQGELGKALDQVLQNADIKNSGHFNEAVLLKARLSQQERLDRMGVVSPGESAVNKNQINYAFLELLKRISKDKSEIVQSDISIGESDLTPEREKVTKILILTASPNNEARLDVNREIREIERTLRIASIGISLSSFIKQLSLQTISNNIYFTRVPILCIFPDTGRNMVSYCWILIARVNWFQTRPWPICS